MSDTQNQQQIVEPNQQLIRLFWRVLFVNILLRFLFALIGYSQELEGMVLTAGCGLLAYGAIYVLLKYRCWNSAILIAAIDWGFQVREWVITFGWQADFQLQFLLLTVFMLLFDHFTPKRRIVYALIPLAIYLFAIPELSRHQPAIALSETMLVRFHSFNVVSFLVLSALIIIKFARIAIREKEGAQRLAKARARLIANLSHELKTPIAAILTTAQSMLRYERSSDKYKNALRLCERNSRSMSQLIRRMLDLSKAGSNAWAPNLQTVDASEILAASIDLHTPLATDDGVELLLVCKGDQLIETDPDLLQIMVNNLIGNAIRYTPRGKSVIMRFVPETSSGGASISVIDEGPGIRPEVLPRIFDAFYQDGEAPGRHASANSNYGLGLALTAELAERLNIKIEVESPANEGARFHLTLPQKAIQAI